MLFYLFLLFITLPVVELMLLIRLSAIISPLGTILLVIGTGMLGATLARWQGMQTLWRLRQSLARGEMPTDALWDGGMILVAATVLVTPGVLTDAFGFLLLTPPFRAVFKPLLKRWLAKSVRVEIGRASPFGQPGFGPSAADIVDGEIVDGEVVKEAPANEPVVEGEVLEIRTSEVRTRPAGSPRN